MSNPSTVWTQLSLPSSPSGAIPFVDTDLVSIITDVVNFYYISAAFTLLTATSQLANQLTVKNGVRVNYTDTSGSSTAAAQTINTVAGRIKIAVGASTTTITCSAAFATSLIFAQLETVDATLTSVRVLNKANGSFQLAGNANATGTPIISYIIHNVY